MEKRKYLCASNYDEKYFNWDCLPGKKPPPNGSIWYTACGAAPPNMVELSVIAIWFGIVGIIVYGNLHLNSFGDDVFNIRNKHVSIRVKQELKKKNK